jgi:hypothetical protein
VVGMTVTEFLLDWFSGDFVGGELADTTPLEYQRWG